MKTVPLSRLREVLPESRGTRFWRGWSKKEGVELQGGESVRRVHRTVQLVA